MQLFSGDDTFLDSKQPDSQLNACIGRQLSKRDAPHYYLKGFRRAAQHLAMVLIEKNSRSDLPIDVVVYPVIFLYRHSFELQLKLVIRTCYWFLCERGPVMKTHSLSRLWSAALPLIERALPHHDWSQNVHVTRLLNELSHLDPNGEAWRYDVDNKGQKHFEMLSLIHVRHFSETADRLGKYLGDVQFKLEYLIEERAEQRDNCRD